MREWRKEGWIMFAALAALHAFFWALGSQFGIGATLSPMLILLGALLQA